MSLPTIPRALDGQTTLITGGGTGIGFMIAQAFAAAGAKVYITGRRLEVLQKAAASVSVPGPECIVALQMDVVQEEQVYAAVHTIENNDRALNILVNNAGVNGPVKDIGGFIQRRMAQGRHGDLFGEEKMDDWMDQFKINTVAPFFVVKAFTDLLLRGAAHTGKPSSVINISSCATGVRFVSTSSSMAYCLSKTALERLTVVLATHFASRGDPIRVNAIAPGVFPSEMMEHYSQNDMDSLSKVPPPNHVNPIPAGRPGSSDEMGSTALYLATNAYATGTVISVDGGLSIVN